MGLPDSLELADKRDVIGAGRLPGGVGGGDFALRQVVELIAARL